MSDYQMLNANWSDDEAEEDEDKPKTPQPTGLVSPKHQTPSYPPSKDSNPVIKEESQSMDSISRRQSLNIKVKEDSDVMTAEDEVDKSMPVRPDPEGQTGSSPASPNSPDVPGGGGGDGGGGDSTLDQSANDMDASSCSSCAAMQQLPNKLDMTKSPAFLKLKAELDSAKEQLQSKEEQVDKLSKIRDEVESEVQELTASLFQEAHKMVGEANEKRVSTEKCLAEATMKIDGLETEVTALKALVLTSTPSQPNRHLHPQLKASSPASRSKTTGKDHRRQGSDGSGGKPSGGLSGKKLSFSLNASPRSNKSMSPTCNNPPLQLQNVVVGAGGLLNGGVCELGEDGVTVLKEGDTACCDLGAECDNTCGFYEERVLIDPSLRQEYLEWKKAPTLDRGEGGSSFLERLYREDVDPCLNFESSTSESTSSSTDLKAMVIRAVHDQTICIAPLKTEEVSKGCPLLNSDRVLCKYTVKCDGCEPFRVSQLARNRIAAVCNLLNYLDYIKKGLVKSHHNEVYKEILQLRKRIVLARLGFSPD